MIKKPSYEELAAKIKTLEHDFAMFQKQDNSPIRMLSEDFQRLADRSQDAIYQFDIESRTFPFFNKKFLALYAVEEDGLKTLSPKSVLLRIHPHDREKVKAARTLSLQPQNNSTFLTLDDQVFSSFPRKLRIHAFLRISWIPGLRCAAPGMTVASVRSA